MKHFALRKKNNLYKNLKLYFVSDFEVLGKNFLTATHEIVRGGASMVQYRDKKSSDKDFYENAKSLKEMLIPFDIPLIINDRVDVALAVEADGVHLGNSDLSCEVARKVFGNKKILGISVECEADVERANNVNNVDYLGISGVFKTETKKDLAGYWGLEGVRDIRAKTDLPMVAIGGISVSNAKKVMDAGADGVAVVSALAFAENLLEETQKLLAVVKS